MAGTRGRQMKNTKKFHFSILYTAIFCALSLLPQAGVTGGEYSGGGILYPVNYQFPTLGTARIAFNKYNSESNGTAAFWDTSFAKVVPEMGIDPSTGDRFVADAEICIDGDVVRSVVPGDRTGEFAEVPLTWEELECRRWQVDRRDHSLPRIFTSLTRAERYIREDNDARGEPYCRDADWELVTKSAPTSYLVKYLADVRGEDELIEVGRFRYRFFECNQLQRLAELRPNFVEDHNYGSEDWIQMAGGEFSGGGKPKRNN